MSHYNLIASTDESTVVAEYSPPYRTAAEYQSEASLEQEFIRLLSGQGYDGGTKPIFLPRSWRGKNK